MKKNNIIVVAAVIVSLAIVTFVVTSVNNFGGYSQQQSGEDKLLRKLENSRGGIKARISVLEKMTQKDWDDEGKAMGDAAKYRAPTLEAAREKNKKRLAEVEKKIADLEAKKH